VKLWKIHLPWALVTLVLIVGFARFLSRNSGGPGRTGEVTSRDRVRELQDEVKRLQRKVAARDQHIRELGGTVADLESERDRRRFRSSAVVLPVDKTDVLPDDEILALLQKKDPGSRKRALQAIRAIPDRNLRAQLLLEIVYQEDARLTLESLALMAELGGPEAINLALTVLGAKGPPWLKRAAADLLSDLGDLTALPKLESAYAEGNRFTKTGAAVALLRLGDGRAFNEILTGASQDLVSPDGGQRQGAVEVLGRLGTSEVLPLLSQALGDSNSRIRQEAADALGWTLLPEAIPLLEKMLKDPEEIVWKAAEKSITRIENPETDENWYRR
jgi:HEAT repeat protein